MLQQGLSDGTEPAKRPGGRVADHGRAMGQGLDEWLDDGFTIEHAERSCRIGTQAGIPLLLQHLYEDGDTFRSP
jgi:hypothetical protein